MQLTFEQVEGTAARLLEYCRSRDWAGHDPYDALNSPIFDRLPFLNRRVPRIALTQLLKRSPVDLRPVLAIPARQNPKALALFLQATLKLNRIGTCQDEDLPDYLVARLRALRSDGTKHWAWGYSFPWQTRTVLVPTGYPNLVCTTFVANALLDAYEQLGRAELLEMAVSAGRYIGELCYVESDGTPSFSYPLPDSASKVHNANLLAAALIARLHPFTQDDAALARALAVARYSAGRQQPDGSWFYGELPTQRWIDNFHTGYNLSGLRTLDRCLNSSEFAAATRRGFAFYRQHFFRSDGAPRYYHDQTYPIDIHCVAQSLITLLEFADLDTTAPSVAEKVLTWTLDNMWSETGGYFYYRVLRTLTLRMSYMRWSQAWMLLALAHVLEHLRAREESPTVAVPSVA